MRKALTLIELIFSMVIIAITFSVIPKLIFTMGKSNALAIQADGVTNAITLMSIINNKAWADENVRSDAILQVSSSSNLCDVSSGYRIGGFVGGRNCLDGNISATNTKDGFDDIDDFHLDKRVSKQICNTAFDLYELNTNVTQNDDNKTINIKVAYPSDYKKEPLRNKCITQIDYTAYNIGKIEIKRQIW